MTITGESKKLLKGAYIPRYGVASPDTQYPHGYKRVLISSVEELDRLSSSYKVMAVDTETTGLSPYEHEIVGFSFCFSLGIGYYVPLRHAIDSELNIAVEPAMRWLAQTMAQADLLLLANARFDFRFIEKELASLPTEMIPDKIRGPHGFDGSPVSFMETCPYYDVLQLGYLADTNVKVNLKEMERMLLGWNPEKFKDVSDGGLIALTSPLDCVRYTVDDVLGPMHLYRHRIIQEVLRESAFIAKVDTLVNLPIARMEEHPMLINTKILMEFDTQLTEEIKELEQSIYQTVGRDFVINSPQQLSKVLEEMGVNTGFRTKTGMSTRSKHLEDAAKKYEVVKKIVDYKKLLKLQSAYVRTLIKEASEGHARFAYHLTRVPTGRLAAGSASKKGKSGFAKVNIQSTPHAKAQNYFAVRDTGPDSILGWKFIELDDDIDPKTMAPPAGYIFVEGQSKRLNLRTSFIVPSNEWLFVSLDYKAQELLVPANLAKEKFFLDSFKSGTDVHKKMAIKLFGADNYSAEKRKIAKILNFGSLYGGTKYTIAQNGKMSLPEAEYALEGWWGAVPSLKRWTKTVAAAGRRNGYVRSHFGRTRWVKYWFDSPDPKKQSFAERTCVNTLVQGCCGDILRVVLVNLWKGVLTNPAYQSHIQLKSTIHDEINFYIRKSMVAEIVPNIIKTMEVLPHGWEVPLIVSCEAGDSWGNLFAFRYENGEFIPESL